MRTTLRPTAATQEAERTSILWRRLDVEGHDCCRLTRIDSGWRLEGTATFLENDTPCGLTYFVEGAAGWRTRLAQVRGTVGGGTVDIEVEHTERGWILNGIEQAVDSGLVDLDLGFTPATNLVALRRLDIAVGKRAAAPAAYLTFPELRLVCVEQSYERLDETRYRYQSPAYAYDEVLTVSTEGFVTDYPQLWLRVDPGRVEDAWSL